MAAQVIETTTLDGAADLLCAQYGPMRLTATGDRAPLIRLTQHQLPGVRLDRLTIGMEVLLQVEAHQSLYLGRVNEGRVQYDDSGGEYRYRTGEAFFRRSLSHLCLVADLEIEWAIIDPALLSQVSAPDPATRGPVRLLDDRPISEAAAQNWWRTYSFIRHAVEADPDSMNHPLVRVEAARLLAAVTLATYPSTARTDPTYQERRDAHPHTLRRAIAYIEANAEHDVTLPEIAASAFVTTRTIQLAFRRHLDTTPMAYVRRVRLQHARQDLSVANPRESTVTAIATRWGFLNSSRFAHAYRAAFGESPHETLRRE